MFALGLFWRKCWIHSHTLYIVHFRTNYPFLGKVVNSFPLTSYWSYEMHVIGWLSLICLELHFMKSKRQNKNTWIANSLSSHLLSNSNVVNELNEGFTVKNNKWPHYRLEECGSSLSKKRNMSRFTNSSKCSKIGFIHPYLWSKFLKVVLVLWFYCILALFSFSYHLFSPHIFRERTQIKSEAHRKFSRVTWTILRGTTTTNMLRLTNEPTFFCGWQMNMRS